MKVVLRQPLANGVLVASREPVALSWRLDGSGSATQVAYEVQGSATHDFAGQSMDVREGRERRSRWRVTAPGPPLRSREVRHLPRTSRDSPGLVRMERADPGRGRPAGARRLARAGDHASGDPGADGPAPSPILRREFSVEGEVASGTAPRHGARSSSRRDQRAGGVRGCARAGLDPVSASAPRGYVRRDRKAPRRGSNVIVPRPWRRVVPRAPGLGS